MLLTLLAALAAIPAPRYDVFLGMPEKMSAGVRGMIQTLGPEWTPSLEAATPIGRDTLVMWSWPMKWTHGIGLQLYGPDGKLKTRLEDSNIPSARATVCADRYVVGGGNTLRVWDAGQNHRLIFRKTFPQLSPFARLSCQGNMLLAEESIDQENWRPVLRVRVPSLALLR
jgi:hypothetical protein